MIDLVNSEVKKYKVSEVFAGIQGEGKSIGTPVVFIRMYGCNLKCEWCDSKYAIEGNNFEDLSAKQIYEYIEKYPQCKTVVFTGGEPLIQLKTDETYDSIFNWLEVRKYNIEIETNGILLTNDLVDTDYITQYNISPKFYSDTEFDWRKKYFNKNMKSVFNNIKSTTNFQFKFVLETGSKREECIENISDFITYHDIDKRDVYIMSEGQTLEEQNTRMKIDLEFCLENGYNYTPRLQVIVYDTQRGV